MNDYPNRILDDKQLEELLSRPAEETVEMFKRLEGDIMFLGIAGKIGPSLANMAKRACDEAGIKKRIIGVSRFSCDEEKKHIEELGIEIFQGDLLERDFLESLPKVKNVFFLAGMKFGSEENASLTWAMNSYLPALIAEHFKDSKIVAYSTGCVYPLVDIDSGGSKETDVPKPLGEYAQSCLGRERMFEYGSKKYNTPVVLIRLNYAVEPRYGVLIDIATKVKNSIPVDLSMGYFNVIWQGDANNQVLRSLEYTETPAKILNITGQETLSVRDIAEEFGKIFGIMPIIVGEEAQTAFLNNSDLAHNLFGNPKLSINKLLKWTGYWIEDEKKILGKPTHFEVRDGKY
ncbi:NAD-dependent epimerase/dehydratase family protein [Aestuariibaculum suncheonense]|uniref:NAD(P)-dependent oxidoreductase n=1 Tax=Aestuariibaculum suncheonense TaxID=1028745 RepID=A0A8J6UK47_9FLAO|nr:NAD(P)-dependent oxidoreductase [Aestuariibaculum suncheonense]MBD0835396.1 NAD(P)-dependent oxidoreductase [Aestuariibaculum suncheonense]